MHGIQSHSLMVALLLPPLAKINTGQTSSTVLSASRWIPVLILQAAKLHHAERSYGPRCFFPLFWHSNGILGQLNFPFTVQTLLDSSRQPTLVPALNLVDTVDPSFSSRSSRSFAMRNL